MNAPVKRMGGAAALAALVFVIVCWTVVVPAAENGAKPGGKAPPHSEASSSADAPSREHRKYKTETLRGRVVWLEDALDRGFGVATEPDAAKKSVVLETDDGRLWPIVPDTRGRAFVVDERLRDIKLELLVRRYVDAPMIQVIRVFRPKDDGLYEVDYWCDICSIPMYILKPCECCQGPTRLRERPVKSNSQGG